MFEQSLVLSATVGVLAVAGCLSPEGGRAPERPLAPPESPDDEACGPQPFADCRWMFGVCRSAVLRCAPAVGWRCEPAGIPVYEAGRETLCDGLDNDCDGGEAPPCRLGTGEGPRREEA